MTYGGTWDERSSIKSLTPRHLIFRSSKYSFFYCNPLRSPGRHFNMTRKLNWQHELDLVENNVDEAYQYEAEGNPRKATQQFSLAAARCYTLLRGADMFWVLEDDRRVVDSIEMIWKERQMVSGPVAKKILGKTRVHPAFAATVSHLGYIELAMENLGTAEQMFSFALVAYCSRHRYEHWPTCNALYGLGLVLKAARKPHDAKKIFHAVEELFKRIPRDEQEQIDTQCLTDSIKEVSEPTPRSGVDQGHQFAQKFALLLASLVCLSTILATQTQQGCYDILTGLCSIYNTFLFVLSEYTTAGDRLREWIYSAILWFHAHFSCHQDYSI